MTELSTEHDCTRPGASHSVLQEASLKRMLKRVDKAAKEKARADMLLLVPNAIRVFRAAAVRCRCDGDLVMLYAIATGGCGKLQREGKPRNPTPGTSCAHHQGDGLSVSLIV